MRKILCFAILATSTVALARDDAPHAVTAVDQAQFEQKNVQAQMQELQERMYRLGEQTRESEPDDSVRLLMAVRKARQQLIIEQMTQALDLLSTNDFSHASDEQVQVLAKLEELKKLLTSTDLDLQLQLEKLRSLNQAIAKLDVATKEQKRQTDRTAATAKQSPPPEAKHIAPFQQDQQQNRRATENIAQTVKDLGGTAAQASTSLGSACQSMSLAEGSLSSAKPSDAQSQQTDALDAMQKARKQLADERDKILQDLERQVRKQVVENLTEMLDRQKSIHAATDSVVHRMASEDREALVRVKQLGSAETAIVRIGEQTISLIEETKFSVALPPAMKRVQNKCTAIASDLGDARTTVATIEQEKRVEKDLQDLLDTFKQLASARMPKSGNCNCKGDKNKLLAELKVVRMMQNRVNDDTKTVDSMGGAMVDASKIDPALRESVVTVHDEQAEVRDAMDRINKQLSGTDEPKDATETP